MNKENEINFVSPMEAEKLPSMCEVRFDCLVTMYEAGSRTAAGGVFTPDKQLVPQWFRSQYRITLETIRYCDEYEIGRQIKQMMHRLDEHIKKYEGK